MHYWIHRQNANRVVMKMTLKDAVNKIFHTKLNISYMCIVWYTLFLEKTAGSCWFLGVDIRGSCSVESSKRSCLKVSDMHILERSQISVNKFTAKDVWSHSCVLLCSRKNCWILLVSWWQVWLRGLKGVLLSLALWREDFWNPNNRTFARISLRWVQLSSTLV